MKIGFTSNSFRNIKDVSRIVEIAVGSGADCIEWSGDIHVKTEDDAVRVRNLCEKAGISISSYGSYYRVGSNDMSEWENVCRIAFSMGAPVVRVWLGSEDSEKTDEETYKKLLEEVKQMCDIAKEYSVKVCPECHDHTFNNNTDAFLRMQKDSEKDNFSTYFQSRYKKYDYDMDRISRTAPFTECVHVSFFDMNREQFPSLKPKYMKDILSRLIETGYDKSVLVEFTYPGFKAGFPFCIKKDISRLRKLIK